MGSAKGDPSACGFRVASLVHSDCEGQSHPSYKTGGLRAPACGTSPIERAPLAERKCSISLDDLVSSVNAVGVLTTIQLQDDAMACPQSRTAIASISTIHSAIASAATPTRVLAGGVPFAKKGARALPMMDRCSGL